MISLNEIISVCILFITSINSGYIVLSRQDFNAHNLAFSDFFLGSEFQQNFQIQVILGSWGIAPQSATCQFFSLFFLRTLNTMVRYSMFLCLCIVVATVLFYVSWPVVSLTFFKDLSKKKKKRFVFAKRLLTLNNLQKTWRACLLEQFKKPVCFEDKYEEMRSCSRHFHSFVYAME